MKQIYMRKVKLPAIRLDLASLEAVINRVIVEAFKDEKAAISININEGNGELSFDSFDDLKAHLPELPATSSDLDLRISSFPSTKSLSLSRGYEHFYVRIMSDSELWNASALEIISSFSKSHMTWYSSSHLLYPFIGHFLYPFIGSSIFWNLPFLLQQVFDLELSFGLCAVFWLPGAILLIVGFRYEQLFPPLVLILSNRESWLNRHSSKITVISAMIGALAAVVTATTAIFRLL
jgi:hypothetical protein